MLEDMGTIKERTKNTDERTKDIATDVRAIRETQDHHGDRILTLEEERKNRQEEERRKERKSALISVGGGVGGGSVLIGFAQVMEWLVKALPK